MKKLFLTSGIIACMACPAFATGFTATDGAISPTDAAGACVEPTLGTYSGTTNFIAQWDKNWYEIDIDSNVGSTDATGGVNDASPDPLYAVVGTGVYQTKDGNGNFSSPVNTLADAFTNSPYTQVTQGLLVNYDLKYNLPGQRQVEDVKTWATSTGDNRPLVGYYIWDSSANNGTGGFSTTNTYKMIDENGKLTNYGTSAASGANADQTWKAKWGAVTPTIDGTPDIYGYSFVKWDLDSSGTGGAPGAITEDSVDVYAIWAANTYTITYTCGSETGVVGTPHVDSTGEYSSATFDRPYSWLPNNDATNCGRLGYHFTGWTCTVNSGGLVADAAANSGTLISNAGVTAHLNGGQPVAHQWDGVDLDGGWVFPDLVDGANITCTAQYEANTISITWDGDHADSTWTAPTDSEANSCQYASDVTLPTTPTREGYVFTGWAVGNGTNGANAPTPDTTVRNQQ